MLANIIRFIYTLLFYLALPILVLRLFWRSLKIPAYRKRISERFGCLPSSMKISEGGIWIHAVSLGEVNAAKLLIPHLQKQFPQKKIMVTTTTVTGSLRVQELLELNLNHVYLPYDIPYFIRKFIKQVKPSLLIIMETELWPNLIHNVYENKIPIVIANARLSEQSAKRYAKLKLLMRAMLICINKIAAQTEIEKERYIKLGALQDNIIVTGNIKFDSPLPQDLNKKRQAIEALVPHRTIWIAASTHEGEEELILKVHQRILEIYPDILLILVPRHPERFTKVEKLIQNYQLTYVKRSQNSMCTPETVVFLGDTMGELMAYYSVADIVFVGGSLMPIGGHNFLEPALLKKPILTGPHTFNFTEIANLLLKAKGLIQIKPSDELAEKIIELLNNPQLRKRLSEHAFACLEQNRGALKKLLHIIETI